MGSVVVSRFARGPGELYMTISYVGPLNGVAHRLSLRHVCQSVLTGAAIRISAAATKPRDSGITRIAGMTAPGQTNGVLQEGALNIRDG